MSTPAPPQPSGDPALPPDTTPESAPAKDPQKEQPRMQGIRPQQKTLMQRIRAKMPTWLQEMPIYGFPRRADENFQLIDQADLKVLNEIDPAIAQQIRADIEYMDYELLRLFKDRDFEAKRNQTRYRQFQLGFLVLASAATACGALQALVLAHNPHILPPLAFAETAIALFTTFLATISGRESPMPRWLDNRRRAEQLRREYFRYLMHLPPYDTKVGYERQTELSRRAADINRGVFPDEPTVLETGVR